MTLLCLLFCYLAIFAYFVMLLCFVDLVFCYMLLFCLFDYLADFFVIYMAACEPFNDGLRTLLMTVCGSSNDGL